MGAKGKCWDEGKMKHYIQMSRAKDGATEGIRFLLKKNYICIWMVETLNELREYSNRLY